MTGAAPHTHEPQRTADRRRLRIALAIAAATALVETIGGLASGSLALLADAGHVASDALALVLALVAVSMAARPHTLRWTFGFHRAEVLAAALNALGLLALAAWLTLEAIRRVQAPAHVDGGALAAVAILGLGANALQLRVIGGSQSVNLRAARLHVLSDLGGSVAAVAAGLGVALTGEARLDPALSLAIVALMTVGALRLLRETTNILMSKAPEALDLAEVERALRTIPGVLAAHDMHAWTITSGFDAFVCHLELAPTSDPAEAVARAVELLRERFHLEHVTIQPEPQPLLDVSEPAARPRDTT
jgi:cobalt-zinc-cadmium efflux system protein